MTTSSLTARLVAVLALLLVAGAGAYWYAFFGPGYDSELRVIRAALEELPEVEVLELAGYDDDDFPLLPVLDGIHARIRVAGGGELLFGYLSEDSVGSAQHLHLISAGPYRIRVRGEGHVGVYKADTGESVRSEFGSGSVDIGPQGEFAHLFPIEIPNIQTAAARYDELLEVVSGWPETPAPPRHLRDAHGTDFYYWVATGDEEDADPNRSAPIAGLRAAAGR